MKRTDHEINELLDRCVDAEVTGESTYPGMSYEQGIKAAKLSIFYLFIFHLRSFLKAES